MNFQAVSVGQKLPVGGYSDANGAPTPNLRHALEHTDRSIGRIVSELARKNLLDSTMIIVTAKHGQAPIDRSKLAMQKGGNGNAVVVDPLVPINAADPGVEKTTYTNNSTTGPTKGAKYAVAGHLLTDSVGVLWLHGPSTRAAVAAQLRSSAAAIFADKLPAETNLPGSIVYGQPLAALLGDPESSDPVLSARAPDVLIQPNLGVVYSGSSKKIAEHGGATADDTWVALLVSAPSIASARTVSTPVTTTQVAPTILRALGVDPSLLQAVRKEGTPVLPSLE
jgi:arylsulfatase A-like enzyme